MTQNHEQLPASWVSTRLEQICEILDARRIPVNSEERSSRITGKPVDALFPYFGATGEVGKIDAYIFDGEYVLLGEDGAPFLDPFKDKAYLANGKFWVNNHAHILKAVTSNRFLCYYLNQFNFADYVTGTTRLKLNQALMKEIPVSLPPLSEQHRIVAKIEELFSELDKGIDSLKTARAQLKVYRQALLKHAFEGKLTAQWRIDNPDKLEPAGALLARIQAERAERYRQQVADWEAGGRQGGKSREPKTLPPLTPEELAELPALPEGWGWFSMESICLEAILGKMLDKEKNRGDLKPYLRNVNVRWGTFN